MHENSQKRVVELRIPAATIVKLLFFALLAAAVVKLWPFALMLVTSVLLAIALEPAVEWLQRHRVKRSVAVILIALAMVAALAAFLGLVIPNTIHQTTEIMKNLGEMQQRIQRSPGSQSGWVKGILDRFLALQHAPQLMSLRKSLTFGLTAIEGITAFLFVLVLTLYLLLDGKALYAWLVSYLEPQRREKLAATNPDVKRVIAAYIRGQLITCAICGSYVWIMLAVLRVPASVPLAVLAFVADLVPVVGTIVMTVPGVLLALTISPTRAAIVLVGYLIYHLVESYFIIPRVYGKEMRLSTLTVLLAVAIGGYLQGPAGAILILPFVAVFPTVERIWLRNYLPEEAPAEHAELDRAEGDRKKLDEVAKRIIEKTDEP